MIDRICVARIVRVYLSDANKSWLPPCERQICLFIAANPPGPAQLRERPVRLRSHSLMRGVCCLPSLAGSDGAALGGKPRTSARPGFREERGREAFQFGVGI